MTHDQQLAFPWGRISRRRTSRKQSAIAARNQAMRSLAGLLGLTFRPMGTPHKR